MQRFLGKFQHSIRPMSKVQKRKTPMEMKLINQRVCWKNSQNYEIDSELLSRPSSPLFYSNEGTG